MSRRQPLSTKGFKVVPSRKLAKPKKYPIKPATKPMARRVVSLGSGHVVDPQVVKVNIVRLPVAKLDTVERIAVEREALEAIVNRLRNAASAIADQAIALQRDADALAALLLPMTKE